MSKPRHCLRNKGYYAGYGFMSIELNAVKGSLPYSRNLQEEVSNCSVRRAAYLAKLKKYQERAK